MLPASSPLHNLPTGISWDQPPFCFSSFPIERTGRDRLWTDISRRLFTSKIVGHILLSFKSTCQLFYNLPLELKWHFYSNSKIWFILEQWFQLLCSCFPSLLSSLPWLKDQGQSLKNTCLRHFATPRINRSIGVSGRIHSGKCEWHCFLTWFLSRIPTSLYFL